MHTYNQPYEVADQSQDSSEDDQNLYYPQSSQIQYGMPAFPQEYYQEITPPQFVQQPIDQLPKFIQKELHQMNPGELMLKRQTYEKEIEKHKFILPLNFIMIAIIVITGVLALIIGNIYYATTCRYCHPFCDSACYYLDLMASNLFIVILLFTAMVALHCMTISAYREKNVKYMFAVFIGFCLLFGISIFTMTYIGLPIYGYFAYSTYKLRIAFAGIQLLDEYMTSQGMLSTPASQQLDYQIQMTTF